LFNNQKVLFKFSARRTRRNISREGSEKGISNWVPYSLNLVAMILEGLLDLRTSVSLLW
jgi:hypothetical protein